MIRSAREALVDRREARRVLQPLVTAEITHIAVQDYLVTETWSTGIRDKGRLPESGPYPSKFLNLQQPILYMVPRSLRSGILDADFVIGEALRRMEVEDEH